VDTTTAGAVATMSITTIWTMSSTTYDTGRNDDRRQLADAGHPSGRRTRVAPPQRSAIWQVPRMGQVGLRSGTARAPTTSRTFVIGV